MSRKSEIIAAIDIGTSKIVALAGRKDANGKVEIVGRGEVESKGIRRGMIFNLKEAAESIENLMEKILSGIDGSISKVFAGISGQHIHTIPGYGAKEIDNEEGIITDSDVKELFQQARTIELNSDEAIYKAVPQIFQVDNDDQVRNPIGVKGQQLSATFKLLVGSASYKNSLEQCMGNAGWPVHRTFINPTATSDVVLSDDEKEAGVVLVDMGAGTTSISVYYDGVLRHVSVIPFGGHVVNHDIKEGCTILARQAEALKVQYGSAFGDFAPEDKVVTIPGIQGWAPKEISFKSLAYIIQARMEEIIDSLFFQIEKSEYFDRLGAGIVMTGGGASMKGLQQLIKYKTGMDVRIGIPAAHFFSQGEGLLESPAYAAAFGLLIKGLKYAEKGEELTVKKKREKKSTGVLLEEVKHKLTLFFAEDQDAEFN